MNPLAYMLVSLVLNSVTGERLDVPHYVSGPFDLAECSRAQAAKGIEKPQDGKVTVYLCQPVGPKTTT
jgi:hypothetical protein